MPAYNAAKQDAGVGIDGWMKRTVQYSQLKYQPVIVFFFLKKNSLSAYPATPRLNQKKRRRRRLEKTGIIQQKPEEKVKIDGFDFFLVLGRGVQL